VLLLFSLGIFYRHQLEKRHVLLLLLDSDKRRWNKLSHVEKPQHIRTSENNHRKGTDIIENVQRNGLIGSTGMLT